MNTLILGYVVLSCAPLVMVLGVIAMDFFATEQGMGE